MTDVCICAHVLCNAGLCVERRSACVRAKVCVKTCIRRMVCYRVYDAFLNVGVYGYEHTS